MYRDRVVVRRKRGCFFRRKRFKRIYRFKGKGINKGKKNRNSFFGMDF